LVRLRVKRFLNNLESPKCPPQKNKKQKKTHTTTKQKKEERSKQLKLNLTAKIK
jgi:hypothetical protein